MEINLRKAAAIQPELKRIIAGINPDSNVQVSEFTDNPDGEIQAGAVKFQDEISRKIKLTNALYNLRKSVSSANATAGVGEILTDIERIDQFIKINNAIATSRGKRMPTAELTKRLEKIRTQSGERSLYSSRDTVETSVLEEYDISQAKILIAELKREKQALQDKLLAININTLISVSSEDDEVLSAEGIL